VTAKLAVLNTDTVQGTTLVPLAITSTGLLRINRSSTISFTPVPVDPRDENYATCWLFKGLDGNVYPAVADSAGALLVDM
jgi:hypothetical protein